MSNPSIATLEKQRAKLIANLEALKRELNDAADAGDVFLISQLQGEITTMQPLVESCDRRLERARAEDATAARQARREANVERVNSFAREIDRQRELAKPLAATVAQLAKQLEAIQASGNKAQQVVNELVRTVPIDRRQRHFAGLYTAGETLGAVLEDLLQKHGIFSKIAPNQAVSPRPHRFPPADEVFAKRGENLLSAVRNLCERVNADI